MIVHLSNFIEQERPTLEELEHMLERLQADSALTLSVTEVERLDYLYHRAASALTKLSCLPATEEVREHFSRVVAVAHAELHDTRDVQQRFRPIHWLIAGFPASLRRHWQPLGLAVAVTLLGVAFGVYGLAANQTDVKEVLLPFSHLHGSPGERVLAEEHGASSALQAHHGQFAAQLMVNNIRVSITAMALGFFFGLGTLILLFYNGVILGAVLFDYLRAGQGLFVGGWLLPHGSIEIPAILIAGQAGFVLGGALIGWGDETPMRERLRKVTPDLVSLMGGVAVMLVWAGIVESFLSQYHEPIVPYAAKIALGVTELTVLFVWLKYGGRLRVEPTPNQSGFGVMRRGTKPKPRRTSIESGQ